MRTARSPAPDGDAVVDDAEVTVEADNESMDEDGDEEIEEIDTGDDGMNDETDSETETPGEDGPEFGAVAAIASIGSAVAYSVWKFGTEED